MCVSIAGVEKTDVNLQMLLMVVNKVMGFFLSPQIIWKFSGTD